MIRSVASTGGDFDRYRDDESRRLMLEFVMRRHAVADANQALTILRTLDSRGLAYLYRDAVANSGRETRVDYDPCEVGR